MLFKIRYNYLNGIAMLLLILLSQSKSIIFIPIIYFKCVLYLIYTMQNLSHATLVDKQEIIKLNLTKTKFLHKLVLKNVEKTL